MHDMYKQCSFEHYWRTGRKTAQFVSEIIRRHANGNALRIADWGCGLGRVIRHMPATYEKHGFDYNKTAIKWCDKHISEAKFFANNLNPPLEADSNSYDVLYALSVFTHLSEQSHLDWITEIYRVLKPGGIFIGAFHIDFHADQLLPGERAKFDQGMLVTRGHVKEGSRTYVSYHPDAYLKKTLFKGFEILESGLKGFGQTYYVVRKPKSK